MKIGAGGLQAVFAQEAARGLETNRVKTAAEEVMLQSEDPVLRRQLYDLNKAVERMRQAAKMYNQPLEFTVKREDKNKPKIKAKDRRTGASREYTLEEAEAWLEELNQNKGRSLNGYA
ncbi:MAG: flagellar protein FlaG [Firmicutes bacterium]|nr:flagellar protein FlaG [Bacillota bacterium]